MLVPTHVVALPEFPNWYAGRFVEGFAGVDGGEEFRASTVGEGLGPERLRVRGVAYLPPQLG
ncbi:hypothetical protein [Streptomyces ipomoeae]|uniref:hypothetical protein n=1 Tax=Streptomyces ipomoeae TaxID=103232 RepID=UPI00215C2C00|nr:hypothetical protein [Streptomyces ipomoeae]